MDKRGFLTKVYRRAQAWTLPLHSFYLMLKTLILWSIRKRKLNRKHGLNGFLVISLTSYQMRFAALPLTLKCLLMQTERPDKILLWIAKEDEVFLTPQIKELSKFGIEILITEDIKSYKKIIPTITKYPDAYVITVDDDLYYPKDMVEQLLETYEEYPDGVIASRTHLMKFDVEGRLAFYNSWGWEKYENSNDNLNFFTSGAGTLFPPNVFHHDVINQEKFMTLAPNADDIWLNWMVRLAGRNVYCIDEINQVIGWNGTQDEGLWKSNSLESGNDKQIASMVVQYGLPYLDREKE